MRQDRRFQPGEAVTSLTVARLLSDAFDWLVAVDPHLHRYRSLSEIYSIPAYSLHAAPLMAGWVAANVERPLLIGPDAESEQWVADVARSAGASYTVLDKFRRGDRDVDIRLRDPIKLEGRTAVLVDDIISSGQTMLKAVGLLKPLSRQGPICIAVHGIFADGSDAALQAQGAQLVTANTVAHPSNGMDVSGLLADALAQMADTKT
jgi:ribose-phosphate pyrophosphokinase